MDQLRAVADSLAMVALEDSLRVLRASYLMAVVSMYSRAKRLEWLQHCFGGQWLVVFRMMVQGLVSNHHSLLRELVFEYLATMVVDRKFEVVDEFALAVTGGFVLVDGFELIDGIVAMVLRTFVEV